MPKKKTDRTGAETALNADIEHLANQQKPVVELTVQQKGRPTNPDSRRSGVKSGTHTHLNVIVASELRKKVAIEAAVDEKDMSEIVEAALKQYFKIG